MRIPDPTFPFLVEHNPPGSGPPEDTVGIGVSFPLPLWNWNRGEIKSAQATVDKNALALAKAKAQAAADVANAQSNFRKPRKDWRVIKIKSWPNHKKCASWWRSLMKKAARRWWICWRPNAPTTTRGSPPRRPCPTPPAPRPI